MQNAQSRLNARLDRPFRALYFQERYAITLGVAQGWLVRPFRPIKYTGIFRSFEVVIRHMAKMAMLSGTRILLVCRLNEASTCPSEPPFTTER